MEFSNNLVTIFGGAGFIGTQLVQVLADRGYRIRVAVRRPDLAGHVKPLGMVGQVMPIQANIRNRDSVERAIRGASIVVNLVGIGHESGKQRFRAVHAQGARNIAEAATALGVEHLVHVSAIGADAQSPSSYARSKALGESEVLSAFPSAVVIRPSIVFGPGDGFINLYGKLARLLPVLPVIGGKSRFQPLYVGDLALAIAAAAEGAVKGGRIYELGGPEVVSHTELVKRVVAGTGRTNPVVPLPAGVAKLLALPLSLLPAPLITGDQVELLQADNVVSEAAIRDKRTLAAFGVAPTAMGAILPGYLWRFMRHGQFDRQAA
ncbi:complex I NDUFA9 subunit family protein [Devosia sp.]|uniref:complex I NDUFA9 subunit family protein n=1 Tax=Devosia sp. TaxID=1871048 RepID=UPI001AD5DF08|nr:complex I NDUFA9 subunit family protein [Devosia sp.]MBN9309754.1 complex I NDUFA9 subunit family protein [Devosia sp.]